MWERSESGRGARRETRVRGSAQQLFKQVHRTEKEEGLGGLGRPARCAPPRAEGRAGREGMVSWGSPAVLPFVTGTHFRDLGRDRCDRCGQPQALELIMIIGKLIPSHWHGPA